MKTNLDPFKMVMSAGLLALGFSLGACTPKGAEAPPVQSEKQAPEATAATKVPDYKGIEIPEVIVTDIGDGKGKAVTPESDPQVHLTAWVYSPAAPANKGPQLAQTAGPSESLSSASGFRNAVRESLAGMKEGGKRRLIIPAARVQDPSVPEGAIVMVEVSVMESSATSSKRK